MAGLTSTGFVEKSAAEILEEINAAQRASPDLGADWDTSAESPQGQMNAIVADALGELWELAGAVYRARDPRGATFAALDALAAITGTSRAAATKGTVTLRVTVALGRTLPAGSIAHVAGQPSNRWATLAPVVGTGSAQDVAAEAELAGAVQANAGTITAIATPVTGWTAVTNTLDAVPGRAADSDPELRDRRDRELQGAATSPVGALAADVAKVANVTQVVAWENASDVTADGIPPHAVEVMVLGGVDGAIAQAIWDGKAAGIATHGSTSATVVDAQGTSRTVRFTRPVDLAAWVKAEVTYDPALYGGTTGDSLVKSAIYTLGTSQLAGQVLRETAIVKAVLAVPGVLDVVVTLGTVSTALRRGNITPGVRQRAAIDTARIDVVRP